MTGNDMSDLIPRESYDDILAEVNNYLRYDSGKWPTLARRLLLTLREKDAELSMVREDLELRCNDVSG